MALRPWKRCAGWENKRRQRMVLTRHRATRPRLKVSPLVCAQHPKYFQGLRRKTVGQETLRESEPMQHADSCDAFSYLLIVCAWCQQYIRWQRVQPPEPLATSHGICTRCYARMSREIEH